MRSGCRRVMLTGGGFRCHAAFLRLKRLWNGAWTNAVRRPSARMRPGDEEKTSPTGSMFMTALLVRRLPAAKRRYTR